MTHGICGLSHDFLFLSSITDSLSHVETHIAHHLSSSIPHHHAWEATEALKAKLGPYYTSDDRNMLVALWQTYKTCRVSLIRFVSSLRCLATKTDSYSRKYVDDEGDVVFYRDAYGRAARQVEYPSVPSDSGVDVQDSN